MDYDHSIPRRSQSEQFVFAQYRGDFVQCSWFPYCHGGYEVSCDFLWCWNVTCKNSIGHFPKAGFISEVPPHCTTFCTTDLFSFQHLEKGVKGREWMVNGERGESTQLVKTLALHLHREELDIVMTHHLQMKVNRVKESLLSIENAIKINVQVK